MNILKWFFGKKEKISKKTLEHSSKGTFNSNGRIISGGHGQQNIDYLKSKGIQYFINKNYNNGVRVGNIPSHKERIKRYGNNQSWFPKNWNVKTIKHAGEVVSIGKKFPDGAIKYGHYRNVNIGIIRTNGEISTIFPTSTQLNKKGVEIGENTRIKKNNRKIHK